MMKQLLSGLTVAASLVLSACGGSQQGSGATSTLQQPAGVGDNITLEKAEGTVSVRLSRNDILHGQVTGGSVPSFTVDNTQQDSIRLFNSKIENGVEFTVIAREKGDYHFSYSSSEGPSALEFLKYIPSPDEPVRKTGLPKVGIHPLLDEFLDHRADAAAEGRFWKAVSGIGAPLLTRTENNRLLVTFLWKGAEGDYSVELLGSKRSFDRKENLLENIEGSDIWFKTVEVSPTTIMTYSYSPNVAQLIDGADVDMYYNGLIASATVDPLNPNVWTRDGGKFGSESLAIGLDAKEHYWSLVKEGVPMGQRLAREFHSDILGVSRDITLYIPPVQTMAADIPVVFIFDGEKYSADANTPYTLDNLIQEQKISPVVAVFVHNTEPSRRATELPCTTDFTNFLADELLPWVRREVPETAKSPNIVTAGSSYGGLASACANLFRPEVFNYVLSQSGSYWWSPAEGSHLSDGEKAGWVVRRYEEKGCNGADFYFDAGELENDGEGFNSIGKNSEILNQLLGQKGCKVSHQRFPGGHDLYHWRETIAHGLIALLGDKVSK